MVPWLVEGHREFVTDNCDIAGRLGALLPPRFTNRDRLVINANFREVLAGRVMERIKHDWDMLDAEERVGGDIVRIKSRFSLLKSEVACLSSVDVACGPWTWDAELNEKSLPPNMKLGVSLPHDGYWPLGTDQFLARVGDYTALVLSVPWLVNFIKQIPSTSVELRYVNERSLGRKAMSDLAEDMRQHGKSGLADLVIMQADKSAFLQIESSEGPWSRWIVFPNREMLLWHFKGDSVLKWKATPFKTWDYYGLQSTGAMVGPEGT